MILGSLCIASWNYFEFHSHMVAHSTNVYVRGGVGGGLSFASFHWTAKSRPPALKDAGGRSLSWLCGPGVRRGEKRRAASSWC